jgi:hypothetical protein
MANATVKKGRYYNSEINTIPASFLRENDVWMTFGFYDCEEFDRDRLPSDLSEVQSDRCDYRLFVHCPADVSLKKAKNVVRRRALAKLADCIFFDDKDA